MAQLFPTESATDIDTHAYIFQQFMTEIISNNKGKAQHFHSKKLFIDDLCLVCNK